MKTIAEKEKNKEESSGVREWMEEDDNEIGDMMDLYYKLQEIPQDEETKERGSIMTWQNS